MQPPTAIAIGAWMTDRDGRYEITAGAREVVCVGGAMKAASIRPTLMTNQVLHPGAEPDDFERRFRFVARREDRNVVSREEDGVGRWN